MYVIFEENKCGASRNTPSGFESAACPGSDDAPTHIGSTKEVWDEEKKYRSQTGFFENFFVYPWKYGKDLVFVAPNLWIAFFEEKIASPHV